MAWAAIATGLISAIKMEMPGGGFMEMVYERGQTDGLPVFPPTDDKMMAMIHYLGRDQSEVIGVAPPGSGLRASARAGHDRWARAADYHPANLPDV